MEFDVVEVFGDANEDLIFRKAITILQFLKKMMEPTWHESRMKKPSQTSNKRSFAHRSRCTLKMGYTLSYSRLGDCGKVVGFQERSLMEIRWQLA